MRNMNKSELFSMVLRQALISVLLTSGVSFANQDCVIDRHGNTLCPPPRAQCVKDRYGDWHCSGPGGGAVLDRYSQPACGIGRCVTDSRGEVMCSSMPGGRAAINRYGDAVCSEGCLHANRYNCQALTK